MELKTAIVLVMRMLEVQTLVAKELVAGKEKLMLHLHLLLQRVAVAVAVVKAAGVMLRPTRVNECVRPNVDVVNMVKKQGVPRSMRR